MDTDHYPNINPNDLDPKIINKLLQELEELKQYQTEITKPFKQELEQLDIKKMLIEERLGKATDTNTKRIKEIEAAITLFFQDPETLELPLHPTKNLYATPYGNITWRSRPASLEITDKQDLITFIENNYPEAIETKQTVTKTAIKNNIDPETQRFITSNGEALTADGEQTPFKLSQPSNTVKIT